MRRARIPYTGLTYKHGLLLSHIAFGKGDSVAEIGVGTGYSCFKLARRVAFVLGIDISRELIELLNEAASSQSNMKFIRSDVSAEEPPEQYRDKMDVVYSIDTLNYVPSPERFFRYVALLLKPGGRAFVSFPNEPREKMEGVTNFEKLDELDSCIASSGLIAEKVLLADFSRWFLFIYKNLWYRIKKIIYPEEYDGETKPQVFDETVAFRLTARKSVNPLVRCYTSFVMCLLRLGGTYRYFDDGDPYDRYVITIIRKGDDDG